VIALNVGVVKDPALDRTNKMMIEISRDRREEIVDAAIEDMTKEIAEIIRINPIDYTINSLKEAFFFILHFFLEMSVSCE